MFYDLNLLCPKKRGKFATVWLVATRGVKIINAERLKRVDITFVCNEILHMVMSTSTRPAERLSLKLAAQLIFGTVRIYRQQIILFERQLFNFCCQVRRPAIFDKEDTDGEPSKKKPKKALARPAVPDEQSVIQATAQATIETRLEIQVAVESLEQQIAAGAIAQVQPNNGTTVGSIHNTIREEMALATTLTTTFEPFGDEHGIAMQDALISHFASLKENIQAPDPSMLVFGPKPIQPMQDGENLTLEALTRMELPQDDLLTRVRPIGEYSSENDISHAAAYPHVVVRQFGSISPDTPHHQSKQGSGEKIMDVSMHLQEQATAVQESAIAPINGQELAAQPMDTAAQPSHVVPARRPIKKRPLDAEKIRKLCHICTERNQGLKINRCRTNAEEIFKKSRVSDIFGDLGPARERESNGQEILERMFELLDCPDEEGISLLIEAIEKNQSSTLDSVKLTAADSRIDSAIAPQLSNIQEKEKSLVIPAPNLVPKPAEVPEENFVVIPEDLVAQDAQPCINTSLTRLEPPTVPKTPAQRKSVSRTIDKDSEFASPKPKRRRTSKFTNIEDVISPVRHEIPNVPMEIDRQPPFMRMQTSTPVKTAAAARHAELLSIIRNMLCEDRTSLTLEDICFPLDRINVSSVFGDLLFLHAKQNIILKSKPHSVELDVLIAGPYLYTN